MDDILNDDLLEEADDLDICDCGDCVDCIEKKGICTCGDCDVCNEENDEEEPYDDLDPEDFL